MPVHPFRAILFISSLVFLAACAASTTATKIFSDDAYANSSFSNFLVIGVAGDYEARVKFERAIVAGLSAEGASAAAFHAVQGNESISRDAVLAAVQLGGFDAVLVTRVKDRQTDMDVRSGSTGLKTTTIGGRPINFFRYDYQELNEAEELSFSTTIVLASELFSAVDEKMIWAIESTSADTTTVAELIDNSAGAIVNRLRSDGLVGR
jgi:hypothetical protein